MKKLLFVLTMILLILSFTGIGYFVGAQSKAYTFEEITRIKQPHADEIVIYNIFSDNKTINSQEEIDLLYSLFEDTRFVKHAKQANDMDGGEVSVSIIDTQKNIKCFIGVFEGSEIPITIEKNGKRTFVRYSCDTYITEHFIANIKNGKIQ